MEKSQLMELIKLREKFEKDLIAIPNNYSKHFSFTTNCLIVTSMQISTILACTQESVVSQIYSNQNMLNAVFLTGCQKTRHAQITKSGVLTSYTSLLKYFSLEKRQERSIFPKLLVLTIVSF